MPGNCQWYKETCSECAVYCRCKECVANARLSEMGEASPNKDDEEKLALDILPSAPPSSAKRPTIPNAASLKSELKDEADIIDTVLTELKQQEALLQVQESNCEKEMLSQPEGEKQEEPTRQEREKKQEEVARLEKEKQQEEELARLEREKKQEEIARLEKEKKEEELARLEMEKEELARLEKEKKEEELGRLEMEKKEEPARQEREKKEELFEVSPIKCRAWVSFSHRRNMLVPYYTMPR